MTAQAPYEVELKFRVTDAVALRQLLAGMGVEFGAIEVQTDQYFQHPARSFVETDEALRLRTIGDQTTLTYKGPVVDRRTKTRLELEVPLHPGPASADMMSLVLQHLSFPPVREVRKARCSGQIDWQGHSVTCSWDEVPQIGTFVELELVTDAEGRATAQQAILSLAEHCGLTTQELRSYLQMTLDRDRAGSQTEMSMPLEENSAVVLEGEG